MKAETPYGASVRHAGTEEANGKRRERDQTMNSCHILACPNSRPRSLAAAWQAFIMRRDTCDRGTSAVLMLPESSFLRAVRTCIAPSVEHTTCDTGEDTDTAFVSRWFGGNCISAIIMRAH